eukprot:CAMPEP_0203669702 /NCGR_PEP_ID=MMETSP0090-20130426/5997_1 /ASSEMBLY_ACC=CAM_ASM_001088 /TAXON_ID=426623 /ORGANISM="Chaetoceros affinis, Strain CCMP159" /LENGTH=895 /DNA_ID=CAMNT_0050534435 /DNA_START=443 /DNA_END=3130 /DNA_ORIENTATION=+
MTRSFGAFVSTSSSNKKHHHHHHHRSSARFMSFGGPGKNNVHGEDDNLPSSGSSLAFNTDTENNASTGTTTTTGTSTSFEQALMEARELKERAAKERLEAEKMSVQLTLDKIASLEKELQKIGRNSKSNGDSSEKRASDANLLVDVQVPSSAEEVKQFVVEEEFDPKMLKKSQDLQSQIQDLKKLLDSNGGSSSNKSTKMELVEVGKDSPLMNGSASKSTSTIPSSSTSTGIDETDTDADIDFAATIPPMSEEVYKKRMDAFKRFPSDVKAIYAKAVGASVNDSLDLIVEKVYIEEQKQKQRKENSNEKDGDDDDESTYSSSLLDIANAQAGYTMLPPPIQEMISESVGLKNEQNTTAVIEKLIETNKVKPTGDFGGVEFAMGDIEDDEEEEKKKRGNKDREFTPEEIKSAIDLFENLPPPMKTMLANGLDDDSDIDGSVKVDSSNSTAIIEAMIKEKKILPSSEGVEFVVFGDGQNDDFMAEAMESLEGDNYVRSMLPAVMRKEGNKLTQADADAFFSEVLGRKTFNPISKPEAIPGGYIIRGENKLKSSDELVAAMEKALEKSSVAGKVVPYYIRDPTLVTEEQFETNTFELPVVMITGPDISPDTNRFVKPFVTVLGGLCVASFSLAVCFANQDAVQDPLWLEEMASPLIISILMTQVAHEAAHQVVAFKDKFKTGAPTIVPSIQLGLTGCITPLKTPPPNFNSLFDFAISGPLVGMIISLGLMYAGLEQQVFMDNLSQSQLPSLPVELVRSSSLAGGLVEWLLGDGVLLSPDPAALIRLHPLAMAGFVGLLANALSLLPIGNTDGGRISLSLFGRSISRVVRTGTIGLIVISSFFGGDTMNILLFYTIFAQIWQRESEITSKNEIENVDDVRAVVAFITGILVALTVIPMF